mgnify:CR=1 FL=1
MSKTPQPQHAVDNRANQLNPQHPAYHQSRGVPADEAQQLSSHDPSALDNHANQLNPQHPAYPSAGSEAQGARQPSAVQSGATKTRTR